MNSVQRRYGIPEPRWR